MSSEKDFLATIPQSPAPDAPPPYDTLTATATLLESIATNAPGARPTTQPIMLPADPNIPSPPPLRPPPSAPHKNHKRTPSASSTASLKTKKSWFQFSSTPASSSRTLNEVRTTVIGLVKDLVRDHSSGSPAALGILTSCAEVCASHSISLSEILQDTFIESHSPLYWAIVKRPREEAEEEGDGSQEGDLVHALVSRCTPLNAETIAELRLACLATSDQVMFQRLRSHFSSTSGTDQVLLGADLPPDNVVVEIGTGTEGAFAVTFAIPQYHKRMMISKEIGLEFVARNRIWRFALLIIPDGAWYGPPPGSWCVSLSLREPSPPTWLDAKLSLLKSSGEEATTKASSLGLAVRSKQMLEAPRNGVTATQLLVPLDGDPEFASLQYSGNSSDEALCLRLEAKLRKPNEF